MATSSQPYLLNRITPMYALRAKTAEKLARKTAGWQGVCRMVPYLRDVPLAKYCWVEITGEYTEPFKLTRALKSCRYLGGVLAEGGEIYLSANLGEHMRYEDLLAELYMLSIASRDDHFWMRVVLHDEAQFGNFPLKIAKFLVRKGALIIKDVRREGVEEQSQRLQRQLDEIAKKTDLLAAITRQIDADEAGVNITAPAKEFPPGDDDIYRGTRGLTLDETNMLLDTMNVTM